PPSKNPTWRRDVHSRIQHEKKKTSLFTECPSVFGCPCAIWCLAGRVHYSSTVASGTSLSPHLLSSKPSNIALNVEFQRHIKKSEGLKTPKVELQISIYGVKILDLKTKDVQHNCQLHRISFCADDKTDKRIFTFICKDSESNKHLCFVFDSEKCAEEITLTIGQAFDLAYKKFLESGGKDVETRKQIGTLQKRIQELETENSELKQQLQDLEEQLMISHVSPAGSNSMKPKSTDVFDMVPFSPVTALVPTMASNGCPPPPPTTLPPDMSKDLFGAEPFDPFTCGSADFPPDIQSKLDEMQEGFKMGLTLEGTVFTLDPLDSRC
uniref:PID domain-containing protein n=1 Tax=Gasterosteus aculeatus aculeatus TaxID=481459 RepID=A0AAQ4RFW5_GASAC